MASGSEQLSVVEKIVGDNYDDDEDFEGDDLQSSDEVRILSMIGSSAISDRQVIFSRHRLSHLFGYKAGSVLWARLWANFLLNSNNQEKNSVHSWARSGVSWGSVYFTDWTGPETGSYKSILGTGPEVTDSWIKRLESLLFALACIIALRDTPLENLVWKIEIL